MTQDLKTPLPPAASSPTASGRRYLSQLMDHAFREGWRTPDDFVRYFPAQSIMGALKSAPELRVKLLAAATGIYEEILRRKSPALAAEDLRIALEEGTTNSLQLLGVFTPEDRVRYLDPHRIWEFLAEDQFWLLDNESGEELRRGATERMTFTLTQAVTERLISLRDVLDGLTYEAVADSLSPHELRAVVRFALLKGREGIGLNERVLLEVLPLEKLVRSVPLDHIWNEVVIHRLAIPCGFTDLSREERRAIQAERRGQSERRRWPNRPSGPPAEFAAALSNDRVVAALPPSNFDPAEREYAANDDVRATAPSSVAMREGSLLPPPPSSRAASSRSGSSRPEPPRSGRPPLELSGPGPGELTDDFNQPLPGTQSFERSAFERSAFDRSVLERPVLERPGFDRQGFEGPPPSRPSSAPPPAAAPDTSDRQRQRVIEHLRAIGRLPPNHPALPTAVLRSIDAMYALLPSATDDIQRKSVIRQTFANENHLRAALLGLIELMDSSVDTADPVIQGAKIEALIKILLFEEQRRKETGRVPSGAPGSSRSSAPLSFAPGGYPTSSYPPGSYAPGTPLPPSYPPSSYPAGGYPAEAFQGAVADAFYPSASPSPRVATQRPPAPVLGAVPGYPGGAPPLPNLPAEPISTRRRTVPPPLPPSYPRG